MTDKETTITHDGEHPLIASLLNLVDRLDYATQDEDALQDMVCELLRRIPKIRNPRDWKQAVKYACMEARRKLAKLRKDGSNYEDSPIENAAGDRRRDQLPGPLKPYDGPEPPAPAQRQHIETIPQHIIDARVLALCETGRGQHRLAWQGEGSSSRFVGMAWTMPDNAEPSGRGEFVKWW
jgi:hypothetical protein